MCWVMPPASRSATLESRIRVEQGRLAVVDVPHHGDDGRGGRRSPRPGRRWSRPPASPLRRTASRRRRRTRAPPSSPSSVSSVVMMVIINRRSMSFLRTSLARSSSFSARSLTVMPSASEIVRVIGGGGAGVKGVDWRCGRRFLPPGGRGGGRYAGRYPTAGAAGLAPGERTGCEGSGRGPPSGALGRDGAGAMGREPGLGRGGAVGRAANGGPGRRVGPGGAFGGGAAMVVGVSDGACFSMRSLSVEGTKRPVGRIPPVEDRAAAGAAATGGPRGRRLRRRRGRLGHRGCGGGRGRRLRGGGCGRFGRCCRGLDRDGRFYCGGRLYRDGRRRRGFGLRCRRLDRRGRWRPDGGLDLARGRGCGGGRRRFGRRGAASRSLRGRGRPAACRGATSATPEATRQGSATPEATRQGSATPEATRRASATPPRATRRRASATPAERRWAPGPRPGLSSDSAAAGGGVGGRGDFTSRGGPSLGRRAGSGALGVLAPLRPDEAEAPENRRPAGRLRLRSRAMRLANSRATISSMVLDALLTSMPCSRPRSSITSWLGIPSTSATLVDPDRCQSLSSVFGVRAFPFAASRP